MEFLPYFKHLLDLLETNADSRKTKKHLLKQVAWAASTSIAGGLLAGPPGALVGAIAGAVYGYCKSEDYDSMVTVLRNFNDADKKQLVVKTQTFIGSRALEALDDVIKSPEQLKELLDVIRPYIKACQKVN